MDEGLIRSESTASLGRSDDSVAVGRYLFVFRPVIDSILNTVFWGEGHKSFAHLVVFSYLSWYGVCGIRFMTLLLALHIWLTAERHESCSDDDAVSVYEETVADLASILRKWKPTSRLIWPLLVAIVAVEVFLEQHDTTLYRVADELLGVVTIVVILVGRIVYRMPPRNQLYHIERRKKMKQLKSSRRKVSHTRSSSFTADSPPASPLLSPRAAPKAESNSSLVYDHSDMAAIDEATPRLPSVPEHMHKLFTFINMDGWHFWKKSDNMTALQAAVPWIGVKSNWTSAIVKGSIDDCVRILNDDDGVRPVKDLSIFQYDKMLKTYRRHGYDSETHSRGVQCVYKQVVIGVAPREVLHIVTSRWLTDDEISHYNLDRVKNDSTLGPYKRVFVLALCNGKNIPPTPGCEQVRIMRHGIIMREIDEHTTRLEMASSMNIGGRIPDWVIELGRGESIKIVYQMREAIHAQLRKSQ